MKNKKLPPITNIIVQVALGLTLVYDAIAEDIEGLTALPPSVTFTLLAYLGGTFIRRPQDAAKDLKNGDVVTDDDYRGPQ